MKKGLKILIGCLISTTMLYGQVLDVTDLYSDNKYFFPRFEHLGENEGLPHYRISSLVEDHQGYLWVGVREGGLFRYDGNEFHPFVFDPGNPYSLPGNDVIFVYEDSRNLLWVATEKGLCFYHPFLQHFVQIQFLNENGRGQIPQDITSITEDIHGNLYVGTNQGIYVLAEIKSDRILQRQYPVVNPETLDLRITKISLQSQLPRPGNNIITDLKVDRKGCLWILRLRDLIMLQSVDSVFKNMPALSVLNLEKKHKILTTVKNGNKINFDDLGNVYVNTLDTLYRIEYKQGTIDINKFYHPPSINITSEPFSANFGKNRKLWLGYPEMEILLFGSESSQFFPLTYPSINHMDIYDHGASCFLKSSSGVIFIGTAWGGLYKFNPNTILSSFHPDLQRIHLNQTNNLRFVYEDSKGYIWLIARDIYRCNKSTGKILETFTDDDFNKNWSYKNKLLEDNTGRIWVGMEGAGLYTIDLVYDKSGNRVDKSKTRFKNVISGTNITALYQDAAGFIWVGVLFNKRYDGLIRSQLFKLSQKGEVLHQFAIADWIKRTDINPEQFINQISSDNDGNIWLAAGFGLIRFTESPLSIINYSDLQQGTDGLEVREIKSVCQDPIAPEDYLWLGAGSGGLVCFDLNNHTFSPAFKNHDLTWNHAASILNDRNGNIWLGTEKGIVELEVSKEGGAVENYLSFNKSMGLVTNDYTNYYGHNAMKTKKGELIFTGPRGFHIIDPQNIRRDKNVPQVHLSNFKLNHEKADFGVPGSPLSRPIEFTKNLSLYHDQNTLSFDISAPDFKSPQHLSYAFLLENYDKNWVNNQNNKTVQFTKLPPGNFTLKVKVANRDGVWGEVNECINIKILKPWWLSYWAYLVYVVIFLMGGWVIHTFQMNRQKMKMSFEINKLEAEKLKEIDAMKTRFFTNISHEFRTPLTLILGPIESLLAKITDENARKSLMIMKRNGRQLQQYINEILDLSKLEARKLVLHTAKINIVEYSRHLLFSFESRAAEKDILIGFKSSSDEISLFADPDKVKSILTNLISNALKYTRKNGRVDVVIDTCKGEHNPNCNVEEGCVYIKVRDNGKGIPEDKLSLVFERYYRVDDGASDQVVGTGLGLALVKELVNLHGGEITVKSKVEEFTEFTVRLPMGKQQMIVEGEKKAMVSPSSSMQDETLINEETLWQDNEDQFIDPDKKIILLIEDNEDMRAFIRNDFDEYYTILEAADGPEGENMAIDTCPDLIICDVAMPKKQGYEVAKDLKNNEITSHIPIIMLTGRALMADKLIGLKSGVDDYLTKPFNTTELKLRINNLLEQREKLKAKYSGTDFLADVASPEKKIEDEYLKKVVFVINQKMADENFNVNELANETGVSRTQLHRKLKATVNQSAGELIQTIRLEKASELIKKKEASISEIAYKVGFASPSYFSRQFKQHFGHAPSEHM